MKRIQHIDNIFESIGIIRTHNKNCPSTKLIMTIVCKNEIDIIETQIRFHLAMGIDGIIVTDHDSTDGTREKLEELKNAGLILEIIDEKRKEHLHSIFVRKMVDLAINKYRADWIINADADEFYYSDTHNVKDYLPVQGVNVLRVYSNFYVPQENVDYLDGDLFIKRFLYSYETEMYGINVDDATDIYMNLECPKVIFKTKEYIDVTDGNHYVKMKKYNEIVPKGITLYHYHTRSYELFEKKVIKAQITIDKNDNKEWNKGWRKYVEYYRSGRLKEFYDRRYGNKVIDTLINAGVICKDPSVKNFIRSIID